jgi:glycosyltransferase involved in cell wall biosynthesis
MNVCLVSREYPSEDHAGGIGTYTEKTARALARMGQSVTVITEAIGTPSVRVEEGVEVHRLAPATLLGPLSLPYTRSLARARAAAAAIHDLRRVPDIVQVCECGAEGFWYSLGDHPATTLVTRLATPSVVVAELSPHAGGQRIRTAYMDWMERTQTRRSNAVISPSAALAEVVSERWGIPSQSITVIRTGVDFAARHAATAAELPPELAGCDFLLYFGRLEERKGVHVLAEALPEVLERYPTLHFVFAGENYLTYRGGPMQAYVERCNARDRDRLHFLPRLTQDRLHPILQSALFVVLPSLWESLANAALEALDMGKPIVATRGCGFGEVVEDGRSGLLVPPADVAALRGAMLTLMADRTRLHEMSDAARAAAEGFRLPHVAAQLLGFYETLRLDQAAKGAGSGLGEGWVKGG